MTSKYRECAAAGRPFHLGTLYDCRSDTIIPALTLWDKYELDKYIRTASTVTTSTDITCDDSFDQKASSIGIEGELKLSVISGLLGNLGGSAKFVRDRVKCSNQVRVVMKYSCKTRNEQLSMNHLAQSNISHPEVVDNIQATHVVVGLDYGADAYFVFDSLTTIVSAEVKQNLSGSLKAKLTKFAETAGRLDQTWDRNDEELASHFTCKIYGDFNLPTITLTVKTALETFATLISCFGREKKFGVPKMVYLLPLACINIDAPKCAHEINEFLVVQAVKACETLVEMQREAQEILPKFALAQKVAAFSRKVEKFVECCESYRQLLAEKFAVILPKIRGGVEKEIALRVILDEHNVSVFNREHCNAWLQQLRLDILITDDFMKMLHMYRFVQYDDVRTNIDTGYRYIVCCVITTPDSDDCFLKQLQEKIRIGMTYHCIFSE